MPGMTVSSSSRTANRSRPSSPSISRPKYQKMAIVMTVQMSGSLASGHVTSRHTSPSRTAAGTSDEVDRRAPGSIAQTNMLATHSEHDEDRRA